MSPNWNHIVRERLAVLRLPPEREIDIVEELALHLEAAYEDALAKGVSEAEAEAFAEQSYDWRLLECELSRAEQSLVMRALPPPELIEQRGGMRMESFIQDLRFCVRLLLKQPGFALIAIFTLALGIGANTAIFSVVNAVLLRPLPYADDERLVMIWDKLPTTGIKRMLVSVPEYIDFRDRAHSFAQVGIYGDQDFTLTGSGEAERCDGALVSANLLSLLGVNPALGRHFLAEENQPDRSHVVILSYGLWQRRFGGDPGLIGQQITLDSLNYTVVGVMPRGFRFPGAEPEIWRPLDITAARLNERYSRWLSRVARLKPGVTMAQAQAEMDALAHSMQREHPEYYGDSNSGWGFNLVPLRNELAGDVREALPILLAVVGCVLLIACANVANLMLSRATARQKEMAVRAALGAGRLRLIRQLLTESILLALAGSSLGMLLALWSNAELIKLGPKELSVSGPVGIDLRVLLFTALVSLLTAMLFGLAPAWQASKLNLNDALKEGGRNASTGRGHLRHFLVIGEIALALTLLVNAGLVLNSFYRLLRVDPGFAPGNVLTMRLALSPVEYPEVRQQMVFYEQALSRIEALPGVQAAGAVHNLPLSGKSNTWNFSIEGMPNPQLNVDFYRASPNYFSAMGMRLASGRFFTSNDREDQPYVAIINETMARIFFAGQNPLGKHIKMGGAIGPFRWLNIVGVVRDVKQNELEEQTKPALYVCFLQPPLPNSRFQSMYLTVRK